MSLVMLTPPLGLPLAPTLPVLDRQATTKPAFETSTDPAKALRLFTRPPQWKGVGGLYPESRTQFSAQAARTRKVVKQFEGVLRALAIKNYNLSPIVHLKDINDPEPLMTSPLLVERTVNERRALSTQHYPAALVGAHGFACPWSVLNPKIQERVESVTQSAAVKLNYCLAVLLSHLIVIDYRLRDLIPENLVRDNVLFFDPGESQNRTVARYTAPTVRAVHDHITLGSSFLDVGSSEGVLSLVAAKNGAKGHALDFNSLNRKRLSRNLHENNVNPSNLRFVSLDINSPEYIRLMTTLRPETLIINIGEHYGITDIQAVRQLLLWPFVKKIILGGYTYPTERQGGERMHALLSGCGFSLTDLYTNIIHYKNVAHRAQNGFLFSSYVYSKD
jgi:hypothetical protein